MYFDEHPKKNGDAGSDQVAESVANVKGES